MGTNSRSRQDRRTPPSLVAGRGPMEAQTARKSSRSRTPASATIVMAEGLPPNDHHPLVGLSPERRAEGRLRTIASVLAKLALRTTNHDNEDLS